MWHRSRPPARVGAFAFGYSCRKYAGANLADCDCHSDSACLIVFSKSKLKWVPMPARTQRTRRKQGRPQKDRPAVGRDTLIAATRNLMKTTPPAQITRLDIARAAGVDPALIRYYFGNKSALVVAAVLQAGAELRDRQLSSSAQATSVLDKIRRRIVVLLEALYQDPSLHHLIIERIIHSNSKKARDLRQDMVFGAAKSLRLLSSRELQADNCAASIRATCF